MVSTPVVPARR